MSTWKCIICGYIYDEDLGEPKTNTPPKTSFTALPESWRCPVCKAGKSAFRKEPDPSGTGAIDGPTVSELLVDHLVGYGVTDFFGVPGTSSLGIIDAIRKNEEARFFLFRHEENAAMAASAYNKLTGRVAACVTIAGPGATNLATGLYDAKEDRASVISLNGQVEMQYAGPGGFQEIDQDAFFRPVTVFNNTIYDRKMASRILNLAMQHAVVRSGVAQISVPNDIQKQRTEPVPIPSTGTLPSLKVRADPELLKTAGEAIDRSENPVILAGWGAFPYASRVLALAKRIDAPVLSTYRAKGILDDDHPFYAGVLGRVGAPAAREMVEGADLLITLGVGFSKMTRVPENIPLVQVDRDPLKLGRGTDSVSVYGDVGLVLEDLTPMVQERSRANSAVQRVSGVKGPWDEERRREAADRSIPIRPPFIMSVLSDEIPKNAIISIDVGENGWWFGRNFRISGQRFVMSGYLATMGFGLPGAIAAKIASPDRPVYCITGDGGFAMAMGDFVTAVKYKLPMVVIILNNHELGMIRVEQQVENYENFATGLHNPDFAVYAKICGGDGIRVEKPDDLAPAVRWAALQDCPVIVDVMTDPNRFT